MKRYIIDSVKKKDFKKIKSFLKKNPLALFLATLVVLLLFLSVLDFVRSDEVATESAEESIRAVSTYQIGSSPTVSTTAKIEKSGVITIVAQAPGIIGQILVNPGQELSARQPVARMSSNYYGGNAPYLQLKMAQLQEENMKETYQTQLEVIDQQRKLAQKKETSESDLREISRKTISDSKNLLELNEEIIQTLDDQLAVATESATILQTKQFKAQLLQGTIQLRSQINQAEYQSSDGEALADLSTLQRDNTLAQLAIQEKSLKLNKEITSLQTKIARVQAATMSPATPFAATVERIHVRQGQFVNAGTPLVTVSSPQQANQAVALVSEKVANSVNRYEPSLLQLGSETITLYPEYVSSEATDGQLYAVYYTIPPEYAQLLTDLSYVRVEIPFSSADTSGVMPFVPLDSVRQTEKTSSVLVIEDQRAVSREVTLGSVFGSYVEVVSGLGDGDSVILQRDVLAGQKVSAK